MTDDFLQALSMSDYMQARRSLGQALIEGTTGTFWRGYSKGVIARFPDSTLSVPESAEIRRALKHHRCYLASYNREPNEGYPANAVLYLCQMRSYAIEQLESKARRDARRALRDLQIEPVDWNMLCHAGEHVFRETRERFGLTDGSPEHFQQRVGQFLQNPAHHVVAARLESKILAFATVRAIDDWAEIEGMFSSSIGREHCPNNGIVHFILETFLANRNCRFVSYGFSSIQEQPRADSLHQFKQKVGFTALPVHRDFVAHPLLRPLLNPVSHQVVKACLKRKPHSKWLRIVNGVLSQIITRANTVALPQSKSQKMSPEADETF
jgi:hypothetical protein